MADVKVLMSQIVGGTGLQYGIGGDAGWGRDADIRKRRDTDTGALCNAGERDCE